MRRVLLAVGMTFTVAAGPIVASTPASAFLEFLFGAPQQQAQPAPYYSSRPLNISVRPKRGAKGHAERGSHHKRELGRRNASKPERGTKHAAQGSHTPRDATVPTRKGNRQVHINPETHPDWFLTDPTIKYGDILVLKSGPVVYQGGSSRTRAKEDFVSLGQSRIISSSRLRDIRMMVSGVWTPPAEPDGSGAADKPKKRHVSR